MMQRIFATLAILTGLAAAAQAGPALTAPTGFGGTAQSTTRIRWAWTDNSNNEMGFRVMSGTVNVSGNLASNTTSWLQTGLSTNTLYGAYFVQAFNGANTANSTGTVSRYTLAAPPTDLAASAVTSTTVSLTWSPNGDPPGTVFQLFRGGVPLSTTTSTSYADSGLAPGTTYTYDVRAFNGDNIATAFAGQITVVTAPPDPPGAPADFSGAAVSETALQWSWSDNSSNEAGFRVMSGTVNVSGDLAANTTTWLQTGLSVNTLYGPYFVQAFNAGGSADSNTDSAYTLTSVPANLAITFVTSTTITLDWDGDGTIYEVWRDSVFLSSAPLSTYTDAGLAPETAYSYEVRAFNGDGIATAFAGPVSTTTATPDPPAAPGDLTGAAVSETALQWSWSDNSDNEAGFRVMSGTVNVSGDLAANTTAWLQTGLSVNTLYGPYFVQAFNSGGTADSNTDSAYTLTSVPANLAITAVTSTTITLDWDGDGTIYEVWRDSVFLSSTAFTTYTDATVLPEVTYSYEVRAFNGDGIATAFAGPVSTTTAAPDAPAAPSDFLGTALSPSSIQWTWSDNSDNEAGFRVLFGTVNVSGDLAANTTAWLQTGLTVNTLYGPYFVQAFNSGGTADSNVDSAYTLTTTPENLAVTAVTSATITLDWTGNGTIYEVWRDSVFLSSTAFTTYTDAAVLPATAYSYEVRAFNGDGIPTDFAGPVSTTTAAPDAPAAPAAPTDFLGAALSPSSIQWTWTDNSDNEAGFRVLFGTVNVSGDLAANTTAWLQVGLSTNTLYGPYFVQAFNAGGTADSNTDSAYTLTTTPGNLAITVVTSATITLEWTGNGTIYEVWRDSLFLSSTSFTTYTDAAVLPETAYSYEVRAFNGDGIATAFAGPVSTTTAAPDAAGAPAAPSGFSGSAASETSIQWSWTDESDDEAGFRVMSGTVNVSGDLAANTTAWLQTGLSVNTLYGPYFVQAFNAGGTADSNTDSAYTLTSVPANLAITAVTSTTITLDWDGDGTIYEVWRDAAFLSSTTLTTHTDAGLAPGTTYSYTVRAFNGDGIATAFAGPVSTVTSGANGAPAPGTPPCPPDPCEVQPTASIKTPHDGASVKGNRLTVLAKLTAGAPEQTRDVRFQYRASSAAVWLDLPGTAQHPNPDASGPYFTHWDVTALAPGSYDLRAVATSKDGAADPSPGFVTITVGAAVCAIEEWSIGGGRLRKQQQVTNAAANVVYASDEATSRLVQVTLPAGRLSAATGTLKITSSPKGLSAMADQLAGGVADFELAEYAGGAVEVSLSYEDADGDGLLDGSGILVEGLRLYAYSTPGGWTPAASRLDPAERMVTATLPSLLSVALFGPLADEPGGPRVFPMPYRPNSGNPDLGVEFSPGNPASGIIFDRLPPSATVKVYTVAGSLVTGLTADPSGRLQWDARNSDGRRVASGGYLAVISASGRKDVVRKLIIIR